MTSPAGVRKVTGTGVTTLGQLVVAQAAKTPDALAAVHGSDEVRYAELVARASALARRLQRLGVVAGTPVAVAVERSLHLPVSLLGVLLAGGACLPLDLSYPPRRLAAMLEDASPGVLVTTHTAAARLPEVALRAVLVDEPWDPPADENAVPPSCPASLDDLAYLIYTSGSSGEPKGVMLSHRGLLHHSATVATLYGLTPADRALQFSSVAFDVSIEEVFPTWAAGGTVVLRPNDVPILGPGWLDWLAAMRLTVLNLPVAHWHEWVRDLRDRGAAVPGCIRLVIVGGERVLGTALHLWQQTAAGLRWIDAYGPAETTITATAFEVPDAPWPPERDPPIGRPVGEATILVVDEEGRRVPPGVEGELWIGGPGVALGYLNRPELTAERFVADPQHLGARMYRSGDLVRELEDGNLEFIGRRDEQVKIRGFRVEVSEVESVLSRHPAVAEVVVVAHETEPGNRRLAAYIVPASDTRPTASALRAFLAERLPQHMVPAWFVGLEALPVTPNGKIDREGLTAPGHARGELATNRVAPASDVERAIAAIWELTLGVEHIGTDDDFFDLGGHSLLAAQVTAAVRQELGVELSVGALFEATTVARLATLVDAARRGVDAPPPLLPQPRRPDEHFPLTLSQEHMWRLEENADPGGLFNITAQHRFAGTVDVAALARAIDHVVQRHETLRTRFAAASGVPWQEPVDVAPVTVRMVDMRDTPAQALSRELHERVERQHFTALDIARPPLLDARLYLLPGERSLMAVTFDHLVCDGTSAYIFLSEVGAVYEAFAAGREPRLRPLRVQYLDYARWQRDWFTEDRLRPQLEYWKARLAGMPLGPAVPFDHVPERPSRRIDMRPVSIGGDLYQGVRRLARSTGSTPFVVTVAAVDALFSRASGRSDVVLSTTLSGRPRTEVDGLIGCFHGIGRLRTDVGGDPAFHELVARARETVLGLLEHQDIPFMRVRQAVLKHMPPPGPALLAAAPTELQYFHTSHDEWAPGRGVVERPGADKGPDDLFFPGHMHPLVLTFLDDGTQLWGELSYKVDFYDKGTIEQLATGLPQLLRAVIDDPEVRLSTLPVAPSG